MLALAWVVAGTWCSPGEGPWAGDAGDARYPVECALGACLLGNLVSWVFPEGRYKEALALALFQHPDAWSDGSKAIDEVSRIGSAGAGGFARFTGGVGSLGKTRVSVNCALFEHFARP